MCPAKIRLDMNMSGLLLALFGVCLLQSCRAGLENAESPVVSTMNSYVSLFIGNMSVLKSEGTSKKNSTFGVIKTSMDLDRYKSSNYSIISLIENINTRLRRIRNVELDITTIQEMFDAMDFTAISNQVDETLRKFKKRMTKKLQKASKIVLDLKYFFDRNITSTLVDTFDVKLKNVSLNDYLRLDTVIQPCPLKDSIVAHNYKKDQIQISNYIKPKHSISESNLSISLNARVLKEIQRLNGDLNNFKHIFYLSNYDYASDHNCHFFFNNIHFRQLYANTIPRKYVFILLDVGSILTVEQMELSKMFVLNIVQMLSESDYLTIITLSDQAEPLVLDDEYADNLVYRNLVTPDNKIGIFDFINGLRRSRKITNHTLGFEYAFNLLRQQNLSHNDPFVFLYVTRGLLARLSDAKSVLQAIARGQQSLKFPIVINTCAVILDEKQIMYEKQFLTDIVQQNYSKYEIDLGNGQPIDANVAGNLYIITKRYPERLIRTSTAIFTDLFQRFKSSSANRLRIHNPTLDFGSHDFIVSITHAVSNFGVVGVNIFLSDIAEDIDSYNNSPNSYIFLLSTNGVAFIHPALQSLTSMNKTPLPVDIAYLENVDDFLQVRHRILTQSDGNFTIVSNPEKNTTKTYTWHHILDVYVICIVTAGKVNSSYLGPHQTRLITGFKYIRPIDLLYHRIDLIPPRTPVCRYIRQIATLDSSTIFLSSSSFQSPFTYLKNNRINCNSTKMRIFQSLMAYIKDTTGLLANPGLLPRIRNDVSAIYNVMEILKKRHLQDGELKNYIIRRYAATVSGVLQVFPGCILATNLDLFQRPWFRKAMQHPGRIIITEPYLDAGGSGYVVTIAHTIFGGRANSLHNSESDSPIAIIALDVSYAFFFKALLGIPLCQNNHVKCILFDNEGYLVAHPSMMEASLATKNIRKPHEHLTHKESYLANDILNHKTLVTKLACVNYQNRTIQRYYSFNTSLVEVLTNVVHSERTKYQITAIAGTNIFAAVLNSTCDGGAFCPCSTVDRICLNCNRMDQSDCECPCECPIHIKGTIEDPINENKVRDVLKAYSIHYPNCKPESSKLMLDNLYTFDWNSILSPCVHINCDIYNTQIECLAVIGCEWCQLDIDGNHFSEPFCTTQNSCFNGVLSSLSPYGDGDLGLTVIEPSKTQTYSAFGPVGGAIMVLCSVIGFAMYCYRKSLENDHFRGDSIHEDNCDVALSRFNFDNISPLDDDMDNLTYRRDEPCHNHMNPIENVITVPDISPYHMSTGSSYRRPPNGESDHGYSTMTPHDDSEHMCFTLAEPLINNKRLSKSDSLSINTSVSGLINHNTDRPSSSSDHRHKINSLYGQTYLNDCNRKLSTQQQLSPHHVLASVTVHRNMEAL